MLEGSSMMTILRALTLHRGYKLPPNLPHQLTAAAIDGDVRNSYEEDSKSCTGCRRRHDLLYLVNEGLENHFDPSVQAGSDTDEEFVDIEEEWPENEFETNENFTREDVLTIVSQSQLSDTDEELEDD